MSQTELEQWNADTARLLKIGLRNHDPEAVDAIHQRISDKLGSEFVDSAVSAMITHLIGSEGWSFFDRMVTPHHF